MSWLEKQKLLIKSSAFVELQTKYEDMSKQYDLLSQECTQLKANIKAGIEARWQPLDESVLANIPPTLVMEMCILCNLNRSILKA